MQKKGERWCVGVGAQEKAVGELMIKEVLKLMGDLLLFRVIIH